jgi:hypothetical protein
MARQKSAWFVQGEIGAPVSVAVYGQLYRLVLDGEGYEQIEAETKGRFKIVPMAQRTFNAAEQDRVARFIQNLLNGGYKFLERLDLDRQGLSLYLYERQDTAAAPAEWIAEIWKDGKPIIEPSPRAEQEAGWWERLNDLINSFPQHVRLPGSPDHIDSIRALLDAYNRLADFGIRPDFKSGQTPNGSESKPKPETIKQGRRRMAQELSDYARETYLETSEHLGQSSVDDFRRGWDFASQGLIMIADYDATNRFFMTGYGACCIKGYFQALKNIKGFGDE